VNFQKQLVLIADGKPDSDEIIVRGFRDSTSPVTSTSTVHILILCFNWKFRGNNFVRITWYTFSCINVINGQLAVLLIRILPSRLKPRNKHSLGQLQRSIKAKFITIYLLPEITELRHEQLQFYDCLSIKADHPRMYFVRLV